MGFFLKKRKQGRLSSLLWPFTPCGHSGSCPCDSGSLRAGGLAWALVVVFKGLADLFLPG